MGRKDENSVKRCVICGTTSGRITRGLCTAHYLKLRHHLSKLTDEGAAELEKRLIAEGKLLPPDVSGVKPKTPDPFSDTVNSLVRENPTAYLAASEQTIDTEHAQRGAELRRKVARIVRPKGAAEGSASAGAEAKPARPHRAN